ncbi:hypothetical protein K439DRAFT_1412034 [Ramaria rubella]|nr:hypothetical protein K439DRAFT_1412034 [Ramaria rubella]
MAVFTNGQCILVATHGPGKLHLYSYGSVTGLPGHVGTITTTRSGISHFVISHSYTFTRYAFYWEGEGSAEYHYGAQKGEVGRSWNNASWTLWGNTYVEPLEVSPNYFQGAVNRDNQVTCFLLPEHLPS